MKLFDTCEYCGKPLPSKSRYAIHDECLELFKQEMETPIETTLTQCIELNVIEAPETEPSQAIDSPDRPA